MTERTNIYRVPSGHRCPACGFVQKATTRTVKQEAAKDKAADLKCPDCGRVSGSAVGHASHMRAEARKKAAPVG